MESLIGTAKDRRRARIIGNTHRGALQDGVLKQVCHWLMVGALQPGQTITLRHLAEILGTSAMPVREAINQLTAANALEMLPNRSVAVPRISAKRYKELTLVRQALEGLAAELACANVTSTLIRKLTDINIKLRRAIKNRDTLDCLSTNQAFHFTLYAAADAEILQPMIESLWLQAGPIMYLSLTSSDGPWDASCHEEVLAALKTKDPVAVRRAIKHDLGQTAKSLLRSSIFKSGNGRLVHLAASL
ncbi:MAG TPA: GntR family transcriptional regulator [Stellaceae bacterium]|nr:GntR family transcriptional regulator [Stellaceae bacterium]